MEYLLSSHLESYFNVRLKLYSFRPLVKLYKSVRKITVSALVNSAFVPEYCEKKKKMGINLHAPAFKIGGKGGTGKLTFLGIFSQRWRG